MNVDREWLGRILHLIAENPEPFYNHFFPESRVDPVGVNLRLQPCPKCGHYDCCTITQGEIAVNCFSPGCFSGHHLKFLFEIYGYQESLLQEVGKFYGLPYIQGPEENPQERRLYEIRDLASKFYHKKLLENDAAVTYQLQTRNHSMEITKLFRVGFSKDYKELYDELISSGYSRDEVREADIWIPEGLIVYPYIDPFSKKITRFNTKNPFNVTYKEKVIQGYSTGSKTMLVSPGVDYNYVILVEGENDLMTVYANGGSSVIAVGGKISRKQLETLQKILPRFKKIYCMFDNDHAGQEYEESINETFPHIPVYHVNYGTSKDPDEAYRHGGLNIPVPDLLAEAELLETKGYNTTRKANVWTIENRKEKLEFEIRDKNRNGSLVGTVKYYKNGELVDMEYEKTLAKCKFKPLNFYLINEIEDFFNGNLESKSFEDLVSTYYYTKWKGEVIRLLAGFVFKAVEAEREEIVVYLRKCLGEDVTDIILKEVNELQNEEIVEYASIPRMKISQFFSVKNGEAFMYFTYVKKDGDTIRKVPYLVTNDKKLIRLDLYKRKDEQCLILIRNRYELPIEVPQAIMDLQRISLSQNMVEKYINEDIEERELDPKFLIRRLENFLRRFYYSDDDNVYKMLALWIYGTYCYELFGQYPYLFLNGPKGSGKTVLDVCIDLLAFNPKMTVSVTNAALFRSISIEGGTLILDEMENLTSRKQTYDNDLAAVLKGGYMRSGCAMRCDKDNGNLPQMFDVFGPKVISNIFGLEDIIGDRCIQINTTSVKPDKRHKLEDPKQLYIDGLSGVRELTSKCALSVLEHFGEIYKTYKEKVFETENARLAQILRPIQALAYIAGTDYEKAFLDFYMNNVRVVKEETEYETPEGALRDILIDISEEILGNKEPNYISPNLHKYKNPIKINLEEGWFEIDVLHIKTFMEEVISGEKLDLRSINTWVRRVSPVNMYSRKRRTTVSIEDESLIMEYNGNTRLKVYVFKFYLTDFLPEKYVAEGITKRLSEPAGATLADI